MVSSSPRARLQATLAALGAFALWAWFGGTVPATIALLTAVLAVLAWVSPRHYAPIHRVLDRLVQFLLRSLTWLVLGLIYLGLFVPLRLWRVLTHQDPLRLRPNPAAPSYLLPLPVAKSTRFDRQF